MLYMNLCLNVSRLARIIILNHFGLMNLEIKQASAEAYNLWNLCGPKIAEKEMEGSSGVGSNLQVGGTMSRRPKIF